MASLAQKILPAGTILSCPDCGEGLYKVARRSTLTDLIFEDRQRLLPLNRTIPPRDAARSLSACPL
jgi:hypothetical protein